MWINLERSNAHKWSATHVTRLENVDHQLLRVITFSHAKVAVEFLYLETGSIPLQFVIKSRRLNYFKNIMDKNENELVKKIDETQKKNPLKCDWTELLKMDFKTIDEEINEDVVKATPRTEFKKNVKDKIYKAALKHLKSLQENH